MKAKVIIAMFAALAIWLIPLAMGACQSNPVTPGAGQVSPAPTGAGQGNTVTPDAGQGSPAPTVAGQDNTETPDAGLVNPVTPDAGQDTPAPTVAGQDNTETPDAGLVNPVTPDAVQDTPAPTVAVTGTVTYGDGVALSAGATLEVELRDVSLQDVESKLIARQIIDNPGPGPVEFEIPYSREEIDPARDYAVSAWIVEAEGRLLFINDTVYSVLTYGYPDQADLVLVAVNPPPTAETPPEPWGMGGLMTDAAVTGTVTYGDGVALSAGATLEVELRDVSLQDVASEFIARQIIFDPGPGPVEFEIPYSREAIDPARDYAVSASVIEADGSLVFTNDTVYSVLTYGYPDQADLVLVAVNP